MANINVAILDSNNVVTNIVVYDEDATLPEGAVRAYGDLGIGDTYNSADDADRIAQDEAEATADANEKAANENRQLRDELLAATDHWGNSDRTMTDAMSTYRQALRDITDHANWPNLEESDWPNNPNSPELVTTIDPDNPPDSLYV